MRMMDYIVAAKQEGNPPVLNAEVADVNDHIPGQGTTVLR
jgi:hypothetical protein